MANLHSENKWIITPTISITDLFQNICYGSVAVQTEFEPRARTGAYTWLYDILGYG
jgi:hypothetical protein